VNIYLDGVLVEANVNNFKPSPVEAYNRPIFSIDGLTPDQHTLEVERLSDTAFIVVDAFDVRGGQ